MAKTDTSTLNKSLAKPAAVGSPAPAPKTAQSLLISLPILAAVLIAIGYIELRSPEFSTAQQSAKPTQTSAEATLHITTQSQQTLEPIPVNVTDSLLNPNNAHVGDTGASIAAQPTVTSLQADANATMTDDTSALQAHKPSQSFEQLLELL